MDFYSKYSKLMRRKEWLRAKECFIHNPGDQINSLPWINITLQDILTDIIPNKYEKFIDYNDNEHFILPFRIYKK